MQREILFRGKRLDNGEWVEGYYTYYPEGMDDSEDTKHAIRNTSAKPNKLRFVYGATVCQCTGLKDKNGNLIWENDIVEIIGEDERCKVEWDDDSAKYELIQYGSGMCDFDNYFGSDLEVIGNAFDNPKLLEV